MSVKTSVLLLGISLLATLVVSACDRELEFYPVGWESRQGVWVLETDSFRVTLIPPGGLVAQSLIVPEPTIENLTEQELTVSDPLLLTLGREIAGDFGASRTERTIPPHEASKIPVYFDLGIPLRDAFGEAAEIRMSYRVGEQPTQALSIGLERK